MENDDVGLSFLKTIPGILKIAEEVANFIGMICVATVATGSIQPRADAFLASSIMALIITAVVVVCHITGLVRKIQIPWYKMEFGFSVFIAIFYLVTSSLVVSVSSNALIAGGIFGYLAILLYVADAYFQYQTIMSE